MEKVAADPSRLLDPTFDMYKEVVAQVSAFAEWRRKELDAKVKAPDGSEHQLRREVLREAQIRQRRARATSRRRRWC